MARKFGFRRKFGNLNENSEEKGKMYFGPEAPPPPSEKWPKSTTLSETACKPIYDVYMSQLMCKVS